MPGAPQSAAPPSGIILLHVIPADTANKRQPQPQRREIDAQIKPFYCRTESRQLRLYAGAATLTHTLIRWRYSMFNAGDFVQSKTGGPKMQVLRAEGDMLWCARIDDPLKCMTIFSLAA
ncbi:hypothetical protein CRX72_24870 [Pantoea sp. BRM17]|nr:hypothetical protein CRX72_24870 [Pantoea sp. BRM17]